MDENTPVEAVEVVHPPEGAEFDNEHGTEVVVYDYDEDGNVLGWHKELKESE